MRLREIGRGLEPFGGGTPRLPRLRVIQPGA